MATKNRLGDSLNPYENSLFYLVARTPEELEAKIKEINMPFKILNIYGLNSRHYAWLAGDVRIVRKTKKGTK